MECKHSSLACAFRVNSAAAAEVQRAEQPAFISKAKWTEMRHACMGADPDIWRAHGMSMKGECLKCERSRAAAEVQRAEQPAFSRMPSLYGI